MPYALLDERGQILSLHRESLEGAVYLPADHPQILEFVGRDPASQSFASLDADLVRVLEDLVDVLISRNIIRVTDLPAEAQQKLFARKHFRESMSAHSLHLFGHGYDGSLEKEMAATDLSAPTKGG